MRAWRNTVVRFGILSIPLSLSPLVGDGDKSGHKYDPATGERVRQAWTTDGTTIVPEPETRYDVPDGDPVALDLTLSGETGIDLEAALHIGDVDASLFDSSYACNPTKDAPRSLATLAAVLRDSGTILVGTARFTESASAKSVVLRWSPLTKGVVLETLSPLERVRIEEATKESADLAEPTAAEYKQAVAFVESLPDVLPTLVVADERDAKIREEIAALAIPEVRAAKEDADAIASTADTLEAFVRDGYEDAIERKSPAKRKRVASK
jgi:non-homologous end joining protein Ku